MFRSIFDHLIVTLNEIQIRHVPLATEDDRRSIETCFVNSKLLLIF